MSKLLKFFLTIACCVVVIGTQLGAYALGKHYGMAEVFSVVVSQEGGQYKLNSMSGKIEFHLQLGPLMVPYSYLLDTLPSQKETISQTIIQYFKSQEFTKTDESTDNVKEVSPEEFMELFNKQFGDTELKPEKQKYKKKIRKIRLGSWNRQYYEYGWDWEWTPGEKLLWQTKRKNRGLA